MIKRPISWLLGCSICILSSNAFSQDILYEHKAFLHSVSPVADGAIGDGEYASSEFLSFVDIENPGNPFPGLNQMCGDVDCNDEDPADGDADLSATIHWGYTDTDFFMAFDVTDQTIDADEGAAPFQNDGVELVIDGDGFKSGFDGARDWSLEGFKLNTDTINEGTGDGAGPLWVEENPGPGEWTHAVELKDDDTGYILEFQVPLGSIDTDESDPPTTSDFADEAVAATTGDTLRMNFAINDIDIEGAGQGEGTHAMWWMVEDDPQSPWGGAERVWVVGMELAGPPEPSVAGDFNGNEVRDAGDIDILSAAIADNSDDAQFDLNGDGAVNVGDRTTLITDLMNTFSGDANLDGEFNSSDFVAVFSAGEYEDAIAGNSTWATGDFNGDGDFDSGDFVVAFAEGGYELGPMEGGFMPTPEPSAALLVGVGLLGLVARRRR